MILVWSAWSSPFSALVSRQRVCWTATARRVCLISLLSHYQLVTARRGNTNPTARIGACDLGLAIGTGLVAGALRAHDTGHTQGVRRNPVQSWRGARWRGARRALWSASCILDAYVYDTRGADGVFAERVGSDYSASASLTVAKEKQTLAWWCPDRRIALYGRGDDDDAAVVIGLTGTGVPTAGCFLYRMSRASQAVSATRYAKRRTHNRLVPEPANSEGAEG